LTGVLTPMTIRIRNSSTRPGIDLIIIIIIIIIIISSDTCPIAASGLAFFGAHPTTSALCSVLGAPTSATASSSSSSEVSNRLIWTFSLVVRLYSHPPCN
jgi:hypothetical protein